jgi:chemotaxis methyl-accepting protein methylase
MHPSSAVAGMDRELQALKKRLSRALDLDLDSYKVSPLERQMIRVLPHLSGALATGTDPSALFSQILIGVSGFLRDPTEFARLRDLVIPALVTLPAPRILSLGCADGSELYSVAMLLAQHAALKKSVLLGLDCNPKILQVARTRVLSQKDKDQLPVPFQTAFLECEAPGRWTIGSSIRDRVQFESANVLDQPLPGTWDLILCRNLLIYLLPDVQTQLVKKCRAALNDHGVLMLGRAERIIRPQTLGWESLSAHLYRKVPITEGSSQC